MAPPRHPRDRNGNNARRGDRKSDVEQMAALYVQARATLVRGGLALHDQVGSSLSAVGVHLQLLRMDVPEAKTRIDETLHILDDALDCIRELSNDLCPSPAYRGGLKQALLRLADQHGSKTRHVEVEYATIATVPAEIAAALYEATAAVVQQAVDQGAKQVNIAVAGDGPLVLRVTDDGRKAGRSRALAGVRALAREQGLAFECTTGKGTIVSYAIRRTARR